MHEKTLIIKVCFSFGLIFGLNGNGKYFVDIVFIKQGLKITLFLKLTNIYFFWKINFKLLENKFTTLNNKNKLFADRNQKEMNWVFVLLKRYEFTKNISK